MLKIVVVQTYTYYVNTNDEDLARDIVNERMQEDVPDYDETCDIVDPDDVPENMPIVTEDGVMNWPERHADDND